MPTDSRLTDRRTGKKISFSCGNRRFKTNIRLGYSHSPFAKVKGSVLKVPLVNSAEGYTLWLEHVVDKESDEKLYWLMWYGPDGIPTIPLSGVFSKDDLATMLERMIQFVPPAPRKS